MATANLLQTSVSGGTQNALSLQGDGVFFPKASTASRLALTLTTTDKGFIVYDTTDNNIYFWNGTAWESVPGSGDAGANGSVQYNDNGTVSGASNFIYDKATSAVSIAGNLGIGTTAPVGRLEAVGGTGAGLTGWFRTGDATAANNAGGGFYNTSSATAASRSAVMALDADGANLSGGDYLLIQKNGNSGTADILQYSNAAMRFGTDYLNRAAFDMTLDASGRLLVGTATSGTSAGDGIIGFGTRGLTVGNSNASVASGSFIDITIATTANGYQGFLSVANTQNSNANVRTQTTFSVFGRGASATFTTIATANGPTAGASFTVTVPSNGVIRITNTVAVFDTTISAQFFGGTSA